MPGHTKKIRLRKWAPSLVEAQKATNPRVPRAARPEKVLGVCDACGRKTEIPWATICRECYGDSYRRQMQGAKPYEYEQSLDD